MLLSMFWDIHVKFILHVRAGILFLAHPYIDCYCTLCRDESFRNNNSLLVNKTIQSTVLKETYLFQTRFYTHFNGHGEGTFTRSSHNGTSDCLNNSTCTTAIGIQ